MRHYRTTNFSLLVFFHRYITTTTPIPNFSTRMSPRKSFLLSQSKLRRDHEAKNSCSSHATVRLAIIVALGYRNWGLCEAFNTSATGQKLINIFHVTCKGLTTLPYGAPAVGLIGVEAVPSALSFPQLHLMDLPCTICP